jgi:diketogulonate reductase-like aldo/keto reductase
VEAQKTGKAHSIGVSNFGIHHLEELEEYIQSGGGGRIEVGQYELHPWLGRADLVDWLHKRGAVVEAYSPLARGTRMNETILQAISKKHNKTPGQILIRWSLQKVSPERMESFVQSGLANINLSYRALCHCRSRLPPSVSRRMPMYLTLSWMTMT